MALDSRSRHGNPNHLAPSWPQKGFHPCISTASNPSSPPAPNTFGDIVFWTLADARIDCLTLQSIWPLDPALHPDAPTAERALKLRRPARPRPDGQGLRRSSSTSGQAARSYSTRVAVSPSVTSRRSGRSPVHRRGRAGSRPPRLAGVGNDRDAPGRSFQSYRLLEKGPREAPRHAHPSRPAIGRRRARARRRYRGGRAPGSAPAAPREEGLVARETSRRRAPAAGSIGVPVCDEYVAKYTDCLEKLGPRGGHGRDAQGRCGRPRALRLAKRGDDVRGARRARQRVSPGNGRDPRGDRRDGV